MSAELAFGIGAIVLGLAAVAVGLYLLGAAALIEMLDGDE